MHCLKSSTTLNHFHVFLLKHFILDLFEGLTIWHVHPRCQFDCLFIVSREYSRSKIIHDFFLHAYLGSQLELFGQIIMTMLKKVLLNQSEHLLIITFRNYKEKELFLMYIHEKPDSA